VNRSGGSTFVLSRRAAPRPAEHDDLRIEISDDNVIDEPLWARKHLVALGLAAGAGLAMIVISWYGSSGTRQPSQQVRWVPLSIIGLAVSAFANVTWVLRCRRVIGGAVRALPALLGWVGSGATPPSESLQEEAFVTAAPATLYHRRHCVFAASGRTLRSAPRAAHERAGLSPCEVCQP
jgi:hypothetical protein